MRFNIIEMIKKAKCFVGSCIKITDILIHLYFIKRQIMLSLNIK